MITWTVNVVLGVYIGILVISTTTGHGGSVISALASQAKGRGSYPSCDRSFFLPSRASEQGNVIGSVRIYIYIMCVQKKIVIERTKDLNYLKFVATDFFPKTISAGENSGDLA